MALQRKSAIKKAPTADVVEALTSADRLGQSEPQPASEQKPEKVQASSEAGVLQSTRRPGPGRPRGKRRMEPFSSKIEINLRDELDAYLAENGVTITDFLDEAIREKLASINTSGQK